MFSIAFALSPESVIGKAKSAIEGQGGTFSGDAAAGTFSVNVLGNIAGSYTISGQLMEVVIDSKPMFIPCSQLESFMTKQFGG